MSSQPQWELLANLGDANPIDYGGAFVRRDTAGVYPPELEILECDDENAEGIARRYTVYRVCCDRCTDISGILSDNEFHPEHSAWFAPSAAERKARPQDSNTLASAAACVGRDETDLRAALCSEDPVTLAGAYLDLIACCGAGEFDQYPLELTHREVLDRYAGLKLPGTHFPALYVVVRPNRDEDFTVAAESAGDAQEYALRDLHGIAKDDIHSWDEMAEAIVVEKQP